MARLVDLFMLIYLLKVVIFSSNVSWPEGKAAEILLSQHGAIG